MDCPSCQSRIPNDNPNIATDTIKCPKCNVVFKISESVGGVPSAYKKNDPKKETDSKIEFDPNFDIRTPPKGIWINEGPKELIIGVSTRSKIAVFWMLFALLWSVVSLYGIYGSQIVARRFDLFMSLLGLLFLWSSALFWKIALMEAWGKVELTVEYSKGKIFTGIGNMGKTQHFFLSEILGIKEYKTFGSNHSVSYNIALQGLGKSHILFATRLDESKRYYLSNALKKILYEIKHSKNFLKELSKSEEKSGSIENFDIYKPPATAWVHKDEEMLVLGASTQSEKSGGIIMMFILALIVATIIGSMGDGGISILMNPINIFIIIVFVAMFSPFLAIALMMLGGKVEVAFHDKECKIFKGLWKFGRTVAFPLDTIVVYEIENSNQEKNKSVEFSLKSKDKTILEQKGFFGTIDYSAYVYLMKSIKKILSAKQTFLEEDLSEHLI